MIQISSRINIFDILDKNIIVAEIGVFKGEFSEIINQKIKPSKLHLVDVFDGVTCSGDKDGDNIVWTDLSIEFSRLQDWSKDKPNITLHKGYSYNILNKFDDDYFDFVYIDGDHSYDGVKKDLEITYKKVKKGGFISGHDYSEQSFPGVFNAVNEFCDRYNLKINYITLDKLPSFMIKKI